MRQGNVRLGYFRPLISFQCKLQFQNVYCCFCEELAMTLILATSATRNVTKCDDMVSLLCLFQPVYAIFHVYRCIILLLQLRFVISDDNQNVLISDGLK